MNTPSFSAGSATGLDDTEVARVAALAERLGTAAQRLALSIAEHAQAPTGDAADRLVLSFDTFLLTRRDFDAVISSSIAPVIESQMVDSPLAG